MVSDQTIEHKYSLDLTGVTAGSKPVPEDILLFSAPKQISIIQKHLGLSATGVWDSHTNDKFTEWLRISQATYIGAGPKQADGWWGPGSQKALEDKIDPELFTAIKGLYERENGNLNSIMYRNRYHQAELVDVQKRYEPPVVDPEPVAEPTADQHITVPVSAVNPDAMDIETPGVHIVTPALGIAAGFNKTALGRAIRNSVGDVAHKARSIVSNRQAHQSPDVKKRLRQLSLQRLMRRLLVLIKYQTALLLLQRHRHWLKMRSLMLLRNLCRLTRERHSPKRQKRHLLRVMKRFPVL